MNMFLRNPKASSLLNVSIGLFLMAMFLDSILKGNTTVIRYFSLMFSVLMIINGCYNFFITFKNENISLHKQKGFGFLSLIIGILFFSSAIMSFYFQNFKLFPLILGLFASIIDFYLAFIFLR